MENERILFFFQLFAAEICRGPTGHRLTPTLRYVLGNFLVAAEERGIGILTSFISSSFPGCSLADGQHDKQPLDRHLHLRGWIPAHSRAQGLESAVLRPPVHLRDERERRRHEANPVDRVAPRPNCQVSVPPTHSLTHLRISHPIHVVALPPTTPVEFRPRTLSPANVNKTTLRCGGGEWRAGPTSPSTFPLEGWGAEARLQSDGARIDAAIFARQAKSTCLVLVRSVKSRPRISLHNF